MGSIVVSDVAHHFPHTMLGANARLPSTHEAGAPQPAYRSEPLRPSQPEPSSNPSLRSAGLVDTPMADAVPRASATANSQMCGISHRAREIHLRPRLEGSPMRETEGLRRQKQKQKQQQ